MTAMIHGSVLHLFIYLAKIIECSPASSTETMASNGNSNNGDDSNNNTIITSCCSGTIQSSSCTFTIYPFNNLPLNTSEQDTN
jgi:hypothetical protein